MTSTPLQQEHSAPLISVVLPVYNAEAYVAEAIQSILDQTFSDFELLIIDDGSTDRSPHILREYADMDSRIRLRSRGNLGLVKTLNELIAWSRGIWIARMDADDIARPQRLARQLEWLQQTGVDVCGSWVKRFGCGDDRLVQLYESDHSIKTELLFFSPFAHPSVMFRAALAKQLPYDDTWIKAEDYDLWIRAAEAGWKMSNVPEPLVLYRVHEDQVSVKAADFQQQQGHKIRRRYWHSRFAAMGLDETLIDDGLKVFYASPGDVNMDKVDGLFAALLAASDAEARSVVFPQLARLYRLMAADCPGIVSRWIGLQRKFGSGSGLKTALQLFFFRILRVRKGSLLYQWIRGVNKWRKPG
jgi:glycosyltransferase involved in cell wall biosynthesis